jgi:hypothetical protein
MCSHSPQQHAQGKFAMSVSKKSLPMFSMTVNLYLSDLRYFENTVIDIAIKKYLKM